VILLAGALHDVWSIWTDRRSDRPRAPVADTAQVAEKPSGVSSTAAATSDVSPPGAPVDLNRAGAQDLESLPGIGPVLARRILEQRQRVGAFHRVEELLAVRGVGPRLLSRLEPLISVSAATPATGAGRSTAGGMHSAPSRPNGRADSASASRTLSR
jgi:competence protein ComEA